MNNSHPARTVFFACLEIENLINNLNRAADDWEEKHPVTYTGNLRVQDALRDAASALSTLQAENANLHDELEKVEAERDAAVNDLNILRKRSGWKCYACFYDDHYDRGVCAGCGYNNDNNWQWRGQKED